MKDFLSALGFLSVLPVGGSDEFLPKRMLKYFPVAGLLIGISLSIFDFMMLNIFSVTAASILDVVFLAAITGAFHIDGLGDTADGLFSHRPRETVLEIMKDSRIGVMGAVTILGVTLVKLAGIHDLETHRSLVLILVPAFSRTAQLIGIKALPYGRSKGLGLSFFSFDLGISSFAWAALPLFLAMFMGFKGIWLIICFAAIVWLVLLFYQKKMGCITGDMLGAISETTEAFLFLTMSIGG